MSAHGLQPPSSLHVEHLACLKGLSVSLIPTPALLSSCYKLWLRPSLPLGLVVTVASRVRSSLLAVTSLAVPLALAPAPHVLCSAASGHGAVSDRLVLGPSAALCASCGLL